MGQTFIQSLVVALATRLRRRRFKLFRSLVSALPRPLRILDVGGEQDFWDRMEFGDEAGFEIVLLNVRNVRVTRPNFRFVAGDATNMTMFQDGEFDIVFSNSVIEHVGDYVQQRRMAEEVRRVGRRYFIQTPNRHFPMEPHFLFPFFQFLPLGLRVKLLTSFDMGWHARTRDARQAEEIVKGIRLLTARELQALFPGAQIWTEKFLGLAKSFVAASGWDE